MTCSFPEPKEVQDKVTRQLCLNSQRPLPARSCTAPQGAEGKPQSSCGWAELTHRKNLSKTSVTQRVSLKAIL